MQAGSGREQKSKATSADTPAEAPEPRPPLVVGVGASAGGLHALEVLFSSMPLDTGLSFVVVQHLSPHYPSHMDDLLGRKTRLTIRRVQDGDPLAPDTIFLLPPKKEMTVANNRLWLTDKEGKSFTLPIDRFLRSLAEDKKNAAIAVILSGTGSDGTHGCRAIRKEGGLVICQRADTAEFPSMPQNIEKCGLADASLAPEEIPKALQSFAKDLHLTADPEEALSQGPELSDLDKLLALLKNHYGIDFRLYKTGTFGRRLQRRLLLTGTRSMKRYLSKLQSDSHELDTLYRDLLVNVTEFFRDREAFDLLRQKIAPAIVASAKEEIRIWTCGCATGEEAYSLAIVFLEEIEKQKPELGLQIFATDAHASSLEVASAGRYSDFALEGIDNALLEKYFVKDKDTRVVKQEVRRKIVFAQHNVLVAAPFTRLDLVVCRNLLIYLQAEPQRRALALFHFALKPRGYLFLGKSETLGRLTEDFNTISSSSKIYQKLTDKSAAYQESLSFRQPEASRPAYTSARPIASTSIPRDLHQIYDKLLARFMPPGVLVDHNFDMLHAFPGAELYLRVRPGRPSHKVVDNIDPVLSPALAQALNQSVRKNAVVQVSHLYEDSSQGKLIIKVEPIYAQTPQKRNYLIRFETSSDFKSVAGFESATQVSEVELDQNARNLIQELQEELDDARENLQTTVEELETSNEELQASNEELVASNEELQSSNEELHSVNEEIYSVNAEYQKKIVELTELTDDIENLLVSTEVGVIFLDRKLKIRRFTPGIKELFELEQSDIGRNIGSFAQKLEYPDFQRDLKKVLADSRRVETERRGADGKLYFIRLLPYKSLKATEGVVITVLDVSSLKAAENEVRRLSSIVENSSDAIISFDLQGNIASWNPAAETLYGYTREQAVGKKVSKLMIPKADLELHDRMVAKTARDGTAQAFESRRIAADGRLIPVSVFLSPIYEDGSIVGISSIARDVSVYKDAIEALESSEHRQRQLASVLENVIKSMPDMIVVFDSRQEIEYASPAARAFIDRFSGDQPLPLQLIDDVRRVMEEGKDYLPIDHRGVRSLEIDSKLRYFLPRIKAMRDGRGTAQGAIVIIQDITELRFLDEMKSNLIATVSHELKTPAVSIRLSLGLLRDESFGALSALQRELVETSQKEIERLIRNLATLLDITRFEEGRARLDYTRIDVDQLAATVLEDTRHAAREANVEVTVRRSGDLTGLRLDHDRMVIAISNLLLNAIKYSPPDDTVELSLAARDGNFVIEVSDHGPGVPEEYRERIFDRFYRAPRQHGKSGTGLGLSIVKSFVDAHHGRVTVRDNEPTGSVFTLEIPIDPPRLPGATADSTR